MGNGVLIFAIVVQSVFSTLLLLALGAGLYIVLLLVDMTLGRINEKKLVRKIPVLLGLIALLNCALITRRELWLRERGFDTVWDTCVASLGKQYRLVTSSEFIGGTVHRSDDSGHWSRSRVVDVIGIRREGRYVWGEMGGPLPLKSGERAHDGGYFILDTDSENLVSFTQFEARKYKIELKKLELPEGALSTPYEYYDREKRKLDPPWTFGNLITWVVGGRYR